MHQEHLHNSARSSLTASAPAGAGAMVERVAHGPGIRPRLSALPTGAADPALVIQRVRTRVGGHDVETDEKSATELGALRQQAHADHQRERDAGNDALAEQHQEAREAIGKALADRAIQSGRTIAGPEATGHLKDVLQHHQISLRDFVEQNSDAAQQAAAAYQAGYHPDHGAANLHMVRSLAAMNMLHGMGYFDRMLTGEEPADHQAFGELPKIARLADDNKEDIQGAYGLSEEERLSIQHYTNAHTNNLMKDSFGDAPTGWKHLSRAIGKIPSTGDLGLIHSGFRVPRKDEGTTLTDNVPVGSGILHGHGVMDQGQKHFMSVATSYNVHTTADRLGEAGTMLAVKGTSGRYINPFGVQGSATDGGEVLYPPNVVSQYKGRFGGTSESLPVHFLQETDDRSVFPELHEDDKYQPVANPRYRPPKKPDEVGYTETTSYGSTLRRINVDRDPKPEEETRPVRMVPLGKLKVE